MTDFDLSKITGREPPLEVESDAEQRADIAAAIAHRACCGSEHDPQNRKHHGYCVVCGVPWPCETASYFLRSSHGAELKP